MNWEIYTAISVVTLSICIILQRMLIHTYTVNPFAYALVFQILVGVVIAVPLIFTGMSLPNFGSVWVPAVASIVLFGLGHIAYAKTLQRVEASVFSVYFASQAVWIMLLGLWWFHESLGIMELFGTLLIFASILMLVRRQSLAAVDRGLVLGLLTGLLFGLAITCWSYVGRHTDGLTWAGLSFLGTAAVILAARPRTIGTIQSLATKAIAGRMALLSVLYAIGCVTMLYAYKLGTFTLVSPLRQTGIIVTVLLAVWWIRSERVQIYKKLAAALVCTLGVMLIVI